MRGKTMKCCHFHPNPAALKSDILYVKQAVAPKRIAPHRQ
ncbi:hypothetical protein CFter6_3122 [Collimonas fungivorans]|uniref:Uncharacterized protein n=1 Tax=Collimonas fungivorans TaxID=158899 RepID=A0A127PDH0_9BURK|nr:hypothetical protein CFter6_3122 [Collimonas fungivorans]